MAIPSTSNALEPPPREVVIEKFDGQNWEKHAHTLAHLSRES